MPRDILFIASAIKHFYELVYDVTEEENDLSEMKMHKLLYFAQKQHYANFGEWLFNEDFEGWVHGPVNREVRRSFTLLPPFKDELTPEEEYTIREVVYDYGKYSAGVLRNLSHQDQAYKNSRKGLSEFEAGNTLVQKSDMIFDIETNDFDSLSCEVE
ncbi:MULTISPECIES: Panacea domain-containing protein [Bacillus]|uniref:Antitoxin SocA-like Panacea domain-containing protein n=1 Tax=Bacillus sonorensis TaxID=119858 RepID=A0ABM6LDM7_9BACI|nr:MULTISPECIES: type II toxin-antitoxin system antitoxin SocA domain-containing protein [Bacillus]ASB87376.1 hypothetical protein S101395_00822 [Bacillus sonorensis]MCY8077362.1 DUF4065 domain-containing protein [Bacillus haynesii]MDI3409693.1 DUF4065 domain-containing protein [Bacillus sonorensis]MEC0340092.1 DUF4065 domain-containing protein [Bacillus sonorensis]MEC0425769.1 DUF4065 domain-containing protein [Bacillus sonorensis]